MKCVLFDMDGVLLDSEKGAFEVFRKSLAEIGILETLENLLHYVGKPTQAIAEEILEKNHSKISVEDFLKLHRARGSYYELSDDVKPMEGLLDLLEYLKIQKIPMGVVSSTSSRNVMIALNRMRILKYFDAVVCGDSLKRGKPSPDGYLKAAEYLQVKAEDCIVIEDSNAGVQAGKAAGMYVIAYKKASPEQDTRKADVQTDNYEKIKSIFIKMKE